MPSIEAIDVDKIPFLALTTPLLQVGMVTFSSTATNNFFLNTHIDKYSLKSAVDSLPFIGEFVA